MKLLIAILLLAFQVAANAATTYGHVTSDTTNSVVLMSTNMAKVYSDLKQLGSANLTNWSGVSTNDFATGLTNAAKAYADSIANGANVTNTGPSTVGMVLVTTDTTGNNVTPTNNFSANEFSTTTLWLDSLTDADTNKLTGLGASTNLVPATKQMLTNTWGNDLDQQLAEKADLAGDTFTGAVYSTAPSTNGPATLELATAGWVRSLFGSGSFFYNSTNVVGTAFDASTYLYVGSEPTNGSRSYTPAAGDYFGTVMTTNRYLQVSGPAHISTYLTSVGGPGSSQYTVHPEIYYCYSTNDAVLLGDYESANQAITHGAVTNRYDWVVAFPTIVSTNSEGFFIVRRFKVGAKTGTDTLTLSLGTNGVNNTPSHIEFSVPASVGANWVASGVTNSTLPGNLFANGATFTNTPTVNGIPVLTNSAAGATNMAYGSASTFAVTNLWASSDNTAAHSIVISPRGISGGAGMGSVSFESPETASVGNSRGAAAVDLQIGRNGVTKAATGARSFAAGTNNIASGTGSIAIGNGNTSSVNEGVAIGALNSVTSDGIVGIGVQASAGASGAVAIGQNISATGANSHAYGIRAVSPLAGQWSYASGRFAADGDAQTSILTPRATMTIATATETNLFVNGTSAAIAIPANTTWVFRIQVVARTNTEGTGDEYSAGYEFTGVIERHNAANTTSLKTAGTPTVLYEDNANWDCNLTADTTNGALQIRATGADQATILWLATVWLTQIGG